MEMKSNMRSFWIWLPQLAYLLRRVDTAACISAVVLPRDAHGTDRPVRAPAPLTAAFPSACHLDAMMKPVAADARLHGALLSEFDGAVHVVHGKQGVALRCGFLRGYPCSC